MFVLQMKRSHEGEDRRGFDGQNTPEMIELMGRCPRGFDSEHIVVAYESSYLQKPRNIIDHAVWQCEQLLSGVTELGAPLSGLMRIKIGTWLDQSIEHVALMRYFVTTAN